MTRSKTLTAALSVLLALALMLVPVLVFAEDAAHTHDFSEVVKETPAAGCENGVKVTRCACGEVQTEILPAPHGERQVRGAKTATCAEDGFTGNTYCADCGKLLESGKTVARPAHTPGQTSVVAPTCTAEGYTVIACTVCGYNWRTDVTPATGHKDADADGVCDVCGTKLGTSTAATDADGKPCPYCGKIHVDDLLDRLFGFFHSILYYFRELGKAFGR